MRGPTAHDAIGTRHRRSCWQPRGPHYPPLPVNIAPQPLSPGHACSTWPLNGIPAVTGKHSGYLGSGPHRIQRPRLARSEAVFLRVAFSELSPFGPVRRAERPCHLSTPFSPPNWPRPAAPLLRFEDLPSPISHLPRIRHGPHLTASFCSPLVLLVVSYQAPHPRLIPALLRVRLQGSTTSARGGYPHLIHATHGLPTGYHSLHKVETCRKWRGFNPNL